VVVYSNVLAGPPEPWLTNFYIELVLRSWPNLLSIHSDSPDPSTELLVTFLGPAFVYTV
jgi:hypothetical protein